MQDHDQTSTTAKNTGSKTTSTTNVISGIAPLAISLRATAGGFAWIYAIAKGILAGLLRMLTSHACWSVGCALVIALVVFANPPGQDARRKQFFEALRHHTNAAVIDANGEIIGSKRTSKQRADKGVNDSDRRGSLAELELPPKIYRDLLVAREDSHIHFDEPSLIDALLGKRHYKGIDLYAIPIRAIRSGGKAGGSSICAQNTKNLFGLHFWGRRFGPEDATPAERAESTPAKLARKWEEYLYCNAIWEDLRANDGELFWRITGQVQPHLNIGRTSRGVREASIMLFNRDPHSLTPGEQAILAAATYRGVQVESLAGPENAQKRWVKVLETARKSAKLAYAHKDPELFRRIVQELDGPLNRTPSHIKFPRRIRGLIESEEHLKGSSSTLEERLAKTIPSSLDMLEHDAGLMLLGQPESAIVHEITISLDWASNYAFKRALDARLGEVSRSYRRLRQTLVPHTEDSPDRDRPEAQVFVQVADEQGYIRHSYLQNIHPDERAPIASLGKLLVLLPLVSKGLKPDSMLCNAYVGSIGNASGAMRRGTRRCSSKAAGARYSLEESIARSLNLPFIDAARKLGLDRSEWLELYETMGLELDDARPPSEIPTIEYISGLVTGRALASPKHMHELSGQLFGLVATDMDDPVPCVSNRLVKSIKISSDLTMKQIEQIDGLPANDCAGRDLMARYLDTQEKRDVMRRLLSAPAHHPSGTLRYAKDLDSIQVEYAKTGTGIVGGSKVTRVKWVTARILVDDTPEQPGDEQAFHVLIMIASDPSRYDLGLGRGLSTRVLTQPIMQELGAVFAR